MEKLLQTEGFEPMKHDVDDNEHSIEVSSRSVLFHLYFKINIETLAAHPCVIHSLSDFLLF